MWDKVGSGVVAAKIGVFAFAGLVFGAITVSNEE
jgi:hypothetical protein